MRRSKIAIKWTLWLFNHPPHIIQTVNYTLSFPKDRENGEARINSGQIQATRGELCHWHLHRLPTVEANIADLLISRGAGEEAIGLHHEATIIFALLDHFDVEGQKARSKA